MKKALWFSRHVPTEAQLDELKRCGYEIAALEEGMQLGGMPMQKIDDVHYVIVALAKLCAETGATMIVGVFAAPIQEFFYLTYEEGGLPCCAAWNTMRQQDGGLPTFEHKVFVRIGALNVEYVLSEIVSPNNPRRLTAEGHSFDKVYEALREAFEDRWPDISFTAGESESHSASTADWINSGDWSNRPSIKYIIREYVLVMLEYFEREPGIDDDWH